MSSSSCSTTFKETTRDHSYADDNYIGEMNENLEIAISNIVTKNERIMEWMACSGLKVNDSKTEICIFHRTQSRSAVITINN